MKRLRRLGFWLGCLGALVLAVSYLTPIGAYAVHGLPVTAGLGAKLSCSGLFVSGRSLDDVVQTDVRRLLPLTSINTYSLDRANNFVTVTSLGLVSHTAIYRRGVGCTLLVNSDVQTLRRQAEDVPVPSTEPRTAQRTQGDTVDFVRLPDGVNRVALNRAVAECFSDESPNREIDTRAVIVVYEGRIVAEQYARAYTKTMRLLGWSASKSVVATLLGTLVANGRLTLDAPPPVPGWKDSNDPRAQITLRQLLNMSSGLEFNEPYDPGSDSTAMLFESHDMGAYAASKPLVHPPGTVWSYSSGTANLLSRLVVQLAGGTLAANEAYARKYLFDPAGMTSATFEPDETGSFVGSSYLYATARDWARFGLLYLNRGTINGRRIVPETWVDFVRTAARADPNKSYGAHFWLNALLKPKSGERQFPHLPTDSYAAEGHNDQFIAIFPSRRAVIVRLGWTTGAVNFDRDKHFAAIFAALPPHSR